MLSATFEHYASDGIEHEVGAVARSQPTYLIRGSVVAGDVRGEQPGCGRGLRRFPAVDAEDSSTLRRGNLRDRTTDPAASTDDRDGFTRLQPAIFDSTEPSDDEVHADRCCLLEGEVCGLAHESFSGQEDRFGVAAIAHEADIAPGAENLGADPGIGAVYDDAREVPSRDSRQHRSRHLTGDILDVRRVDGGG